MKRTRPDRPERTSAAPLLADHPSLDFLNTRPGIRTDNPAEHLANGDALLAWLAAAGLLSSAEAIAARRRFARAQLDMLAVEARALREGLRAAVATWQRKGGAPSSAVLAELNRLLAAGPTIAVVRSAGGGTQVTTSRRVDKALALLTPVAEAFAELFAHGNRNLVRECGGAACSLWFYDRTKAHRRRWCSMGACGARAKAAAYRVRKRPGDE